MKRSFSKENVRRNMTNHNRAVENENKSIQNIDEKIKNEPESGESCVRTPDVQSRKKRTLYGIVAVLSLIVFFISMLPLAVAKINVGVVIPAVGSILLAVYCLLSLKFPLENIPWKQEMSEEYLQRIKDASEKQRTRKTKFRKSIILGIKKEELEEFDKSEENYVPGMLMSREKRVLIDRAVWTLVAIAVFMIGVISYMMLNGYTKFEGKYRGQTVVVLGAKVNGNKPSQSLRYRLDGSIKILKAHKDAKCIVSGGQGKGETVAEADVMSEYLLKNGIERDRIFIENKSKNTRQNIEFSKELAKNNNLSQKFIVVTDKYHLYRASTYCKVLGIEFYGYGVKTRKDLVISYWTREMMAVFYELILG